MSDHLPPDVWKDIFTRLPVKVILQMRLVCKEFHLIISDLAFRAAHIKKSGNNHKLLLRHFSNKERQKKHHYLMLNDEDEKLDVKNSEEIKFPLKVSQNPNSWMVGSLDGLVCLSKGYSPEDEIVLWNPSIRKCMHIPNQKGNKYDSNSYCVLGLGFEPKTKDYKVVRITYLKNNVGVQPRMELFTLGSQSWRALNTNDGSLFVIHENIWPQAYLNGAVHWIGYEPNRITSGQLIISFDMTDESFAKIVLPDVFTTEKNVSLSVLNNMLSVLIHNEMSSGQGRFSIWLMEEYGQASSWIRHYTIDLPGKVSEMIGFRKNGEAMVATNKGQLKIYDPETERMRDMKQICGNIDSFSLVSYRDSLVLLDQTGAQTIT